MRIISQGGHADLPYEEIAICMASEDIIARHNDKEYLMARYSTMEKAKKAMEMLRDAYNNYDFCINLTTENILKSYANSRPKEEFMKYAYPYFKFPKDEDVDV